MSVAGLAVLTPYCTEATVELAGSRWRKQILPLGSVNYKGRVLQFDKGYLGELARSFREKAFPMVAFQLADAKNSHTNDPERTRGKIVDLEVTDSGLDVILDATPEGDKVLRENPELGVSARIYEDYTRSDGKHWEAALQHVLGTLDPHVPDLQPWQEVSVASLSNDDVSAIVDLTNEEFRNESEEEEEPMANLKDTLAKLRENGDEAELSDDELDLLLSIVDQVSGDQPQQSTDTETDDLTDEELEQILAEAGALDDEEEETTVAATNQSNKALELTNARIRNLELSNAKIQKELDERTFENEKRMFATQFGIPPYITELARDVLQGESGVIEFANGTQVDPGSVVRRVFTEIGKQVKILDLGGLLGNANPEDDESLELTRANEETAEFVKTIRNNYTF
jgi:hypothetical protein